MPLPFVRNSTAINVGNMINAAYRSSGLSALEFIRRCRNERAFFDFTEEGSYGSMYFNMLDKDGDIISICFSPAQNAWYAKYISV